ncbi:hypothetical protein GUJ93_ZPchr0008g11492 [Zizania palustris]|uniref:Uncharacterized protein n=1 Tax=Zizania palustris TaxID=103762 RepID=A0A8J5QZU5_ZIZPA|nr:hypothetical protein GUJ93_ZPchr0008g11492 [Zizania palustris]
MKSACLDEGASREDPVHPSMPFKNKRRLLLCVVGPTPCTSILGLSATSSHAKLLALLQLHATQKLAAHCLVLLLRKRPRATRVGSNGVTFDARTAHAPTKTLGLQRLLRMLLEAS